MNRKFNIFNYKLVTTGRYGQENQRLIEEFEDFISEYGQEIFSEADIAGVNYNIGLIEIQSVLDTRKNKSKQRTGGKAERAITAVKNTINEKASNNSSYKDIHQQKAFLAMHRDARGNFFKLINHLERYIEVISATGRRWNEVWYGFYREV